MSTHDDYQHLRLNGRFPTGPVPLVFFASLSWKRIFGTGLSLIVLELLELQALQSPHNHQTSIFPVLRHIISVQPPRSTRSSSLVTLARPTTSSSFLSVCLTVSLESTS